MSALDLEHDDDEYWHDVDILDDLDRRALAFEEMAQTLIEAPMQP
jgi:hypothetical protein